MIPQQNIDTLSSNLRILQEREAALRQLRALVITDMMLPLSEHSGVRDIIQTYRKYMPFDNSAFSVFDRAELCKKICLSVKGIEHLLFSHNPSDGIETVAYVKNQYSTEALSDLRTHVEIRGEKAFRSFNELCDDIEAGVFDDCIIPLENTSNGRLMNFYSIIDRFDLKITLTCDVESQSGDQVTRYALLRRHPALPLTSNDHYFEFSFTSTDNLSTQDVLNAASYLGLKLHRIDSMMLRYNESCSVLYPVMLGSSQNILQMTTFLKLNLLQHTMIGIYDRI